MRRNPPRSGRRPRRPDSPVSFVPGPPAQSTTASTPDVVADQHTPTYPVGEDSPVTIADSHPAHSPSLTHSPVTTPGPSSPALLAVDAAFCHLSRLRPEDLSLIDWGNTVVREIMQAHGVQPPEEWVQDVDTAITGAGMLG